MKETEGFRAKRSGWVAETCSTCGQLCSRFLNRGEPMPLEVAGLRAGLLAAAKMADQQATAFRKAPILDYAFITDQQKHAEHDGAALALDRFAEALRQRAKP